MSEQEIAEVFRAMGLATEADRRRFLAPIGLAPSGAEGAEELTLSPAEGRHVFIRIQGTSVGDEY